MAEMQDYSGPFKRDIRYEDLSKETLARLLQAYCRELLTLDSFWQEQMSKRAGEEVCRQCLIENWCRIGKSEMKWTIEALNIQGNDLEAYVKANQFVPSFAQGIYDYDWELKDKNHAILTVNRCPAFSALKDRDPEKLEWTCNVLEEEAMKAYIKVVNPNIQVKPLKVGISDEPDEIACQWEFRTQ
ncbi:MAG: DUF6125 family protein [Dehalococcoidia bacterium]